MAVEDEVTDLSRESVLMVSGLECVRWWRWRKMKRRALEWREKGGDIF